MKHKNLLKLLLLSIILISGQLSFGQVTPETMKQIQSLLQEKNSRTPTQRKIDSRLLQAVRENRGEQMTQNVTLERVNVNADNAGMLKVDIKADISDPFLSKITSLGGKIIYASPEYHTVRALLSLKTVETLAGYPEVKFVEPAVQYMLVDKTGSKLATPDFYTKTRPSFEERATRVRSQLTTYLKKLNDIGSVTSQGDVAHRAADVRSTYGYLGQGIKIGVLSDSYNATGGAPADVTHGDLPGTGNPDGYTTPVTVVQDFSGGSDEGRAMLQVIHDLAPAAILYFATADVSEAGFASNIKALRTTYNCNIILDDVGYFDEPAFQDGIAAQAVDAVTVAGALYFSAAGNSGALAKGTSGVFEGDFNDAGSVAFSGSTKGGTVHNFGTVSSPVNGDIITAVGEVYNLTWSDPYGASSNDYDLFLVSAAGKVKGSSTNVQSGTQNPYEQITAVRLVSGDRLVVFKTTAAAVRAFHLNTNRGTLTVATNGQTTGHACAINAFCMAATPAATAFESGYPTGPYPGPFVSTNKVEPFSSDGPRRIFYNPDGSAITAGNFLFKTSGGTVLSKPDLTAADGVSTTFASSTGLSPFFGTSCAAPHAGAIAALLLSANPSLTPAQVRTILTTTALDVEGTGYDINSGYGIIQAFQAAGQVTVSCGTPTGLGVSSVTTTGATTGWTAVTGATSYTLQYKASTASSYTQVTGIAINSDALTGLSAGTKYYFEVLTVCSSGSSPYSILDSFTTASGSCGTPTGLTVSSVTTTGATTGWTAVTGASSYTLQYKASTASSYTQVTGITTNSQPLTGLTAGTKYYFEVQTVCTGGSSSFSVLDSFITTSSSSCNSTYDGTAHNTFATAVAIPSNTNINGTISTATDVDYYKFTVTTRGTATITLTTLPADYDLYIYNSSQTLVASSKKSGTTSESNTRTYSKGTFYIKIIGFNGAFNASSCYTLKLAPGTAVTSGISASETDRFLPTEDGNGYVIFPNPVSSVLNINAAAITSGATIRVIDIYGKTVMAQQATSSNSQINVRKLATGTYLLMIINKDGSIANTSKFVKQ